MSTYFLWGMFFFNNSVIDLTLTNGSITVWNMGFKNLIHAILNIVINSDVRYWLISFPEEVLCNVPNLVDIVLKSGVIYWFKGFSKEVPSKFLKCYN